MPVCVLAGDGEIMELNTYRAFIIMAIVFFGGWAVTDICCRFVAWFKRTFIIKGFLE